MNPEFFPPAILFFVLKFFAGMFEERKFSVLSVEVQKSLRKKIHEKLFDREMSGGELFTILFDTMKTLDDFFVKVAPNLVALPILLPIFFAAAAVKDFTTAIILLVTLPIAPLLLYLTGKATAEKNSRALSELQKLNGEFKEILSATVTLKIFDRINPAAKKLKAASKKSSAATLDVLKFAFVSSFMLELLTTLSIALVAVTLGLRLVSGNAEFESALFLLLITPEFFAPIRRAGTAFHILMSAKESIERLKKFFAEESPESPEKIEKLLVPPEISLEKVSFVYPQKKSPALREISVKFPAGKISCIVGESGSGKTTLLKILAGLYLPTDGEIFFNDLPAKKFRRESLFEKIAYMPQSPHLFDTSLEENFSFFNLLDDKNLPELLKSLDLNFPDLSAKQKLSRGQIQRSGFIRVLLKDKSILILDEPTAGLDEITEKKFLKLLKDFSLRRTVIIASHRRPVIEIADFVVNLEVAEF